MKTKYEVFSVIWTVVAAVQLANLYKHGVEDRWAVFWFLMALLFLCFNAYGYFFGGSE